MKSRVATPYLALCLCLGATSACAHGAASTHAADPAPANGDSAAASVPTPPSPAPAPEGLLRGPTDAERTAIEALARRAEGIRQLAFDRPVRVEIRDERSIVAHLTRELEDEELARGQAIYTALGLLPPGMDLLAELRSVLGEQVVGFYDPEEAVLVVRDDVAAGLGNASPGPLDETRLVLVHELVHALQDQRLGLGRAMDLERDSDPDTAFHCLVEGDATLSMLGPLVEGMGMRLADLTGRRELLARLGPAALGSAGSELADAPAIVRLGLLAPYFHGLTFVASLHHRGGFPAIDAAHRRPPLSMEQVLHPEAYVRGEAPIPVALPALATVEAAGFTAAKEDTLGELELGIYFGQVESDGYDDVSAVGWGGDRLRLYQHVDGRAAIVWFSVWDTEGAAIRAEEAATRVRTRADAFAAPLQQVVRKGRAVMIARGLPPELHGGVADAFARFALEFNARRSP